MPAVVNPYNKVIGNLVMTASKDELTLMLYDGAIKFCNQALAAIEKNEHNNAHMLIMRVEDIIREFQITLDPNYEISKNMDELYDYIFRRLVEANMTKDKAALSEARDLIREFRDAWKEAMKLARQQE